MNAELKKIKDWLRSQGATPKSYGDLSKSKNGSSLVSDTTAEAYDYDSIIKSFYAAGTAHTCSSCDALLLKEHLYFIEFKSLGRDVNIFGLDLGKRGNNAFEPLRWLATVKMLSQRAFCIMAWCGSSLS